MNFDEKNQVTLCFSHIAMFCIYRDWWTLKQTISHTVVYNHHQPHPGQNTNSDSEQDSGFLVKEEIKLGTKAKWEKHTKEKLPKQKTNKNYT